MKKYASKMLPFFLLAACAASLSANPFAGTGTVEIKSPHPPAGQPEELVFPEPVLAKTDFATEYDPLQGQCYRANLMRTGVFEVNGVPKITGIKWSFKTGGEISASPVAVDGIVYAGSMDGHFYAIDAATGQERWKFKVGTPVRCSALVHDGTVYFGAEGFAYALDAATGAKKWDYKKRGVDGNSPLFAYGLVFFADGSNWEMLDPKTGKLVRTLKESLSGKDISTAALYRQYLAYAPNGYNFGLGLDLSTERKVWNHKIGGYMSHNAMVIGDGVCYQSDSWQGFVGPSVSAVDLNTLGQLWARPIEEEKEFKARGHSYCSPAYWQGLLFIGAESGSFYAMDAKTGKTRWTTQLPKGIKGSPAISAKNGILYLGCGDKNVYAFDAMTGKELWKFALGDEVNSSPWAGDGVLYVGCDDGNVYCLH